MSTQPNDKYFASLEGTKCAGVLQTKFDVWGNGILTNGLLSKLRDSYLAYHGAYYSDAGSGHQITFGGEQGELTNFPVNDYRNIATHMLNMTTSNRPAFECSATNSDYKSARQTILANHILEYYLREKKLETFIKKATEYAIVYGSGFVVMQWNATAGNLVDYDEDTNTKIFDGDIEFENLSPFDVLFDTTKENNKNDWVMIRRWKNKYDLAAKYPEFAEKLIATQTKSDSFQFQMGITSILDETDDIQVLEFFHNRTDSMPDGRYMMFCTSDIVLQDSAMPYRVLPVFRISPGDIHGTPYGYTPMFDLLPLQEANNSLWSTILTNQSAFGVQNILNPRGSDIQPTQLAGGLNVIDYTPSDRGGGKPEALSLTATSPEIFKFSDMIVQKMETISGVNSVARGNPEASLKSGTALALVQSMALQFISGLQQSYVELVEDLGGGIIKMLQDYANTPRLIAIAGKSNRNYMKEFTGEDICAIGRVSVTIGNPMATHTAGRVQMAQELIQYGKCTPQQYVNVIKFGDLDSITDETVNENLLIRAENEAMMDGQSVTMSVLDSHKLHIDTHRSLSFDPDLRLDQDLMNRVMGHIQEHIEALRTTDPDLLVLLNQQPLMPPPQAMPPQGPPPGAPQQGPGPSGPQGHPAPPPAHGGSAGVQQPPTAGIMGPGIQGGHIVNSPNAPAVAIAKPATVSPALLPNPALQAQQLNNLKK